MPSSIPNLFAAVLAVLAIVLLWWQWANARRW